MLPYLLRALRSAFVVAMSAYIGSWLGNYGLGWSMGVLICVILAYADGYPTEWWRLEVLLQVAFLLTRFADFPATIVLAIVALGVGISMALLAVQSQLLLAGFTLTQFIAGNLAGKIKDAHLITPPKNVVEKVVTRLPGPRPVIIQPDAAVVMVRGAKQTRIIGPQAFYSERSEYVSKIYNLKPIHKSYHFERVLTQDLIATLVHVAVTYGVDVAAEARSGERKLNQEEIDKLKNLNNQVDDWESEIRTSVEQQIRYCVGQHLLTSATNVTVQPQIEGNIRSEIERRATQRGIRIYELQFIALQPDPSISQAREENWLTGIRGETLMAHESARSDAWASAIIRISEAYRIARDNQMPDEVIYRELLRRMFEQVAVDPATRKLIPPEVQQILRSGDRDERT